MAIKTFTTGEVLTASDTNTYLANSGLVFIKSQTVGSAVSSVAVTDAFSATYDNYKIIYHGGTSSTSGYLGLKLGASTSTYYGTLVYGNWAANTVAGLGINNASNFSYAGGLNQNAVGANIDLLGPYLSKYTYICASAISQGNVYGTAIGDHETATSYTDFTFIPSTGTISGGVITVYGYRKA